MIKSSWPLWVGLHVTMVGTEVANPRGELIHKADRKVRSQTRLREVGIAKSWISMSR